jgi:type 1 fimbria pilin
MRILAVVVVLLALTSCSADSEWEGDVKFKVTRIAPAHEVVPGTTAPPYVVLALDQAEPKSIQKITTAGADEDQFPPGVKVDDSVVCKVRQYDDNSLDDVDMKTTVGPCRRA